MIWTCNCGYVNEAGADECLICGRKQEDMKSTSKFNPDEMLAKMQTKEYVIELKDVLMEYIKDMIASTEWNFWRLWSQDCSMKRQEAT